MVNNTSSCLFSEFVAVVVVSCKFALNAVAVVLPLRRQRDFRNVVWCGGCQLLPTISAETFSTESTSELDKFGPLMDPEEENVAARRWVAIYPESSIQSSRLSCQDANIFNCRHATKDKRVVKAKMH